MTARGRVVVVSGPSGCGKTSVCAEVVRDPRFVRSISATTRAARPGERDGRDYFFLPEEEFRRRLDAGGFIEWAEVYGRLYGTPREPLERALDAGRWVVLNIDPQGAEQLRGRLPALGIGAIHVFLVPPSLEVLERRLRGRNTDDEEVIRRRLARARAEMGEAPKYDAVVVNDDLARAAEEVKRVVVERSATSTSTSTSTNTNTGAR